MQITFIRVYRNSVIFFFLVQRGRHFYKWRFILFKCKCLLHKGNFYWFLEILRCLLFTKNNQLKVILILKKHIWSGIYFSPDFTERSHFTGHFCILRLNIIFSLHMGQWHYTFIICFPNDYILPLWTHKIFLFLVVCQNFLN